MIDRLENEKHKFEIEITELGVKPKNVKKFYGVSKDAFKIYILKYETEILYIGITKTYLSSRFKLGFDATKEVGNNGYHGYKWIKTHKEKDLNLLVLVFPKLKNEEDRKIIETIEAELVYCVREKFKKWPECQNEIHFYNMGEEIIKFSKELFSEIIIL